MTISTISPCRTSPPAALQPAAHGRIGLLDDRYLGSPLRVGRYNDKPDATEFYAKRLAAL